MSPVRPSENNRGRHQLSEGGTNPTHGPLQGMHEGLLREGGTWTWVEQVGGGSTAGGRPPVSLPALAWHEGDRTSGCCPCNSKDGAEDCDGREASAACPCRGG